MDIGVVLQTTPPSARVVDLAKRAETYGFSHVWTFDSHLLWEEPFPIFTQILAETRTVTVGPMVTNPLTRDWTVTASLFATLNEMFGNRTVIGIGRGDSAVRVINGKPSTLRALGESVHVIRELVNGREVEYRGSTLRLPWASKSRAQVWMAGYGPKALRLIGEVGDGFILQLADPDIAAWTIGAVRRAAKEAGRDPAELTICVAAPAFVGDDLAYARDQCRWFGGMVGNHVADIVARYGETSDVPAALTDYIKGREGYDYNEHGQVGNVHTAFVPDEIVDRFCILGPVTEHVRRLQELQRWVWTSSRCTYSTTPRTRRSRRTGRRSCRRSPSTSPRGPEPDRAGRGGRSTAHPIAQVKHPVALDHHVRILQQVLRVDRPEVALAGPEHDGYDVHAHLVDQARGKHLATDVAGGDLDDAVTRKLLRLGHGCLDAVDEVKRRLGVPALGLRPVRHDDHVVDPARRLPVPAVRHVEDVAADDRHPDLVPVRPDVVVGRLRHLQHAALVQRHVTAGQPVEQGSGLIVLVRDEAVHRHRAVHDHVAHGALLCLGMPPN